MERLSFPRRAQDDLSAQLTDDNRRVFAVAVEGLAEASCEASAASGPEHLRILARSTAAFAADAGVHLEREEAVLAPLLVSRRYVLAPPVIRILCAEHHALAASRAVARGLAARLPQAVLAAEPACALLAHLAAATQAFAGHLSITDLLFPLVLRLERDGALR